MDLVSKENEAVKELEEVLNANGWYDGWNVEPSAPVYYRNYASTTAQDVKLVCEGQSHTIYIIYGLRKGQLTYSGNIPYIYRVALSLTIYYDDAFIFYNGVGENPYQKYITGLLEGLQEKNFAIDVELEDVVPSGDENKYLNRKIVYITKSYI